jgi:lysozyme
MRLRAALLAIVPLLGACGAQEDALGTAQEALTICPGATTLEGIDVSHYDGTIDWATVKASGRAFAFAKATEGTSYVDPEFTANWAGMKQHGVVRSAYHFFHANMDPTAEANHFLSVMGTLEAGDLPPTLDLEVTDNESAATITANTITWLDTVAAATGTLPILYSGPSFIRDTLGSPAGLEQHARLWDANWAVQCPDVPAPFTGFSFWQYDDAGTVPGISGASSVDLDKFNGDMNALKALTVGASSSSSSSSSTSSSGSTSSSSGAPPPTCNVGGVDGICIDVSICAGMPGYVSTPGYCPGPASEQCCTPTGSSTTSSSSSGAASTTSSSSGGGQGGSAGGAGGAGEASSSGSGGSLNATSGCSAAPSSDEGARPRLVALALAALGIRRISRRRSRSSS